MGSASEASRVDALIVGAGFSGITALYNLRKQGLNAKIFEAASDFGGVWYWNRYPGARVDSEAPFYQLSIPEVWKTWNFSQRFPDRPEIFRYMTHIDQVLNIRNDTFFNTTVVEVTWNDDEGQWTVRSDTGRTAKCKYLILASGLLYKKYVPDFPGLSAGDFKGTVVHSTAYPEDLDLRGKKVAIFGAGATAVQITSEVAKQAERLTVFVRRPSNAMPMRNRELTAEEQAQWKGYYPQLFDACRSSLNGFPYRRDQRRSIAEASPEERQAYFEEIWSRGAFNFLLCNYTDLLTSPEASQAVYDFWKKKTRARLTDPAKQAIMAPDEMPFFFGTRRSPLEHDYYEMLNEDHVRIVDMKAVPLRTFNEKGVVMQDGSTYEFDVAIFATGFDTYTGSMFNMGLKSRSGINIRDLWKDQIHTYLGITISDFPNAFIIYSPQAPTALTNGTTLIEAQADLVSALIAEVEKRQAKWVEPTPEAETRWADLIARDIEPTLLAHTDSWWNRGNVGGKTQPLLYIGGLDQYSKDCMKAIESGEGFKFEAQCC